MRASETTRVLVVVVDAHEDGALHGKHLAGSDLRLGEGLAEVVRDAHDLAGGLHLRPEDGVDAGEFAPGKDGRLDEEVRAGFEVCAALDLLGQQFLELAADHEARGDLGQRHAGGLGDVGDGARGAWVDLDDEDLAALDGELNVDQADDVERRAPACGCARGWCARTSSLRSTAGSTQEESPEWMPASSMCCMMPAMTTSVAVAERVDVALDGVFEEVVDEHGALLRVLDRGAHVADGPLRRRRR